jgi:hypothetical protein
LITNSLIAVGLSAMILLKDKDSNEADKTNILLTLGLIFWFIANIIWAYYELVLDIVSPVPSLADLFLLSAYGFLIYRLINIYKRYYAFYCHYSISYIKLHSNSSCIDDPPWDKE